MGYRRAGILIRCGLFALVAAVPLFPQVTPQVTPQDAGKLPDEAQPSTTAAPENANKLPDESQLPPDEDAAQMKQKEYGFNPVQSRRELEAGMVYWKKGNYKAAAARFQEATKWNDGNAEAWLRLGEADEKRGDPEHARAAYRHYLDVAHDGKGSGDVKKRLERLK